jgi:hypothetical protein
VKFREQYNGALLLPCLNLYLNYNMDKKITLKFNKQTIERAKKFAKKNNQSLSGIVESYFNFILRNKKTDTEISPSVIELSGIIKLSGEINIKDMYHKHLVNKYLKR